MTFNAIAFKMMKENYKQYLLYLSCNAFAIMFLFLFLTIYYNKTIEQMKESHSFDTVLSIPIAALLLFMFFFIQYAHQMFIKKRKGEFGILLAVGMTPNNLTRLLITENAIIAGTALFLGLLLGAIFSKIFFFLFTYFSSLSPDLYYLSFIMFRNTLTIYALIFCLTIAITVFQIRNESTFTVIQSKHTLDKTKTTNALFGITGFLLIIISILGLFLTYKSHDELLFLWAILTFFGLYLFLANVIHTVIYLIKGNPTLSYRFILLFSSLEQKQKKLTSLFTLTSVMIMITTLYCTITLIISQETYKQMLSSNPSDIAFISDRESIPLSELSLLFKKENSQIEKVLSLPFIELKKEDSTGFHTYTNIISIKDYEMVTGQNFLLRDNECLYFINQSTDGGFIQYENYEIGTEKCEIISMNIEQQLTHISNSVEYIVVSDNFWTELTQAADVFYQYHIFLSDWENSLSAVQNLKKSQPQLQYVPNSLTSKIEHYTRMNEENSILYYIMTFLSILFYFGTFILLYLNLLADIDIEKIKLQKLFKLGVTKTEMRQQFNWETAILFFLPTLLGIVLAFAYLIGLAQDNGEYITNGQIMKYFVMMSGIYFIIQLGFYTYARIKLFKEVWRETS